MNSLWTETAHIPGFSSFRGDMKTDVLIIGGGMSGLLCAYLLEQAGVDYILVEADTICSGITKNTTAKITAQHGLVYDKLIQEFGVEKAGLYLRANEAAIDKYRELCKDIDCDFETKDSYVYSISHRDKLEAEIQALEKIGYNAEYVRNIPLPMENQGAVRFSEQAQFHPLKFVASMADSLHIYEHTKITELAIGSAKTEHGTITADQIIVATHFPILNKHGGYFLKMYQSRSYVLALENAQDVNGMYLDECDTGLSFRNYRNLLLLGGGDHRTGKQGGSWNELHDFVKEHYPKSREVYRWATQDCMTLDQVPYIGTYGKHTQGFYVSTGFNKWGMTSSMVAAMLLRDRVLGVENEYAEVFDPHRTVLRSQLFVNAAEATANLLTISGKRCPHLGCALKWNQEEHTWDCPCHGSRFTENGELVDNPATDDLKN